MRDLGILLEKAEVLGKITNTQKQQLVSLAVRRVLERAEAEALFWQGDPWNNVLMIASGGLRSVIHAPDGRSYVASTWERGKEF